MSKITVQDVVSLDSFQFKMSRERDIQLDAIKVASRSDDQANSACNLVKALYHNFGWLVQRTLMAYSKKMSDSPDDVKLTDNEEERLSNIIYNLVYFSKQYELDAGEKELLEPIKGYADMLRFSMYSILYSVGVSNMKPANGRDSISYTISSIESMKKMISDLLSGYNPYNSYN